jgi:hypothetical protein
MTFPTSKIVPAASIGPLELRVATASDGSPNQYSARFALVDAGGQTLRTVALDLGPYLTAAQRTALEQLRGKPARQGQCRITGLEALPAGRQRPVLHYARAKLCAKMFPPRRPSDTAQTLTRSRPSYLPAARRARGDLAGRMLRDDNLRTTR